MYRSDRTQRDLRNQWTVGGPADSARYSTWGYRWFRETCSWIKLASQDWFGQRALKALGPLVAVTVTTDVTAIADADELER